MKIKFLFVFLVIFIYALSLNAENSIPTRQQLEQIKSELEKMLLGNIVPFWYPRVIDSNNGGYLLNHDIDGKWLGDSDKYLVTQARTLWFFSKLSKSKYGTPEHLKSARHGYIFLRDKMWDKEYGGFFWSVDSTGNEPKITYKHLYGQGFALYAISEYAIASSDINAINFAQKLFSFMEFLSHDSDYGGYREFFMRDWTSPKDDELSPMGSDKNQKLMNTHLHLMEAITTYYQATKDPVARERLIELISIQSNAVVRKNLGACTDRYMLDWTPLCSDEFDRVSYGHDIENIWLLMEACNASGINRNIFVDLYKALFDYSLKYGYDRENGGFYDSGKFNSNADKRSKTWWVQAECLVSLLSMYSLTDEIIYFDNFRKTLAWVNNQQIDWKNGDWFSEVLYLDKPSGLKASAWKSPYHNGRAVLKCIELIDNLINSRSYID